MPPASCALLRLGHFLAQLEQQLRNLDLDRTHLGARAAQARRERQPGILLHAVKLRRDDRADRSRINPRIIVPADLAIHRAMIQARAAANAVQRLPLLRIGQQLGAAVVEQHQVKLVRTVDFARAAAAPKETTCTTVSGWPVALRPSSSETPPDPARAESPSRCPRWRCGSSAPTCSAARCLRSPPPRRRRNRPPGNSRR